MICFNREVRSPGTADGRHFVSPTCPNRIRQATGHDPIRAVPWPGRPGTASTTHFHVSVIIAPQPAGRARRMGGASRYPSIAVREDDGFRGAQPILRTTYVLKGSR